jgi:hypothetical protein
MEDVMTSLMTDVMPWAGAALDGAVIVLLVLVLWRLRRDPTTAWREREEALREIFGGLRTTVAQAEGLARDLDARLAEHHTRLRALLRAAGDAARPSAAGVEDEQDGPPPARRPPAPTARRAAPDALARAHGLARAGTAIAEIARQLDVSPAEARVMVSLGAPPSAQFTSAPQAQRERRERGLRQI